MKSIRNIVISLKASGFGEKDYTTCLQIPRNSLTDLINKDEMIRETKNASKIFLVGSLIKGLSIKGYDNPTEILRKEKIDGKSVFEFIVSTAKTKHEDNEAIEKLLRSIFDIKYPAKKKVSSVERFESRFKEKVNSVSLLCALKNSPQYVCDIINDSDIPAIDRAEILELFSEVYTPDLFKFVSSKVNDSSPFIKSMAIETLIRYALNNEVDHNDVEEIVYPAIKNEESDDIKGHLSELYEYLEVAS